MLCLVIPFLLALGVSGQTLITPDPSSVDFIGGQHINVGTIDISLGATDFCVTFNTVDGWYMIENHLWVGTNRDDMPQNKKGNPQLGHFPYGSEFSEPYPTTDVICIPYTDVLTGDPCGQRLFVAAHAAVEKVIPGDGTQEETAWGDGDGLESGSWAMIFQFEIICQNPIEPTTPPTDECEYGGGDETAWAFGNTQFWDIMLPDGTPLSTRWGWAHCMSTSAGASSSVTQDLWAGAGQNKPSNGQDVGDVTYYISCDASACTFGVTVIMDDCCQLQDPPCPDDIMDQVHIDVGIGQAGVWTVAPGQLRDNVFYGMPGAEYHARGQVTTGCTGANDACNQVAFVPGDTVCAWTHVNALGFCETA